MSTLQTLKFLGLVLIACGTALVLYLVWPKPQTLPLPPGPKSLPLIGNLLFGGCARRKALGETQITVWCVFCLVKQISKYAYTIDNDLQVP